MVGIVAVEIDDVERDSGVLRERLEELAEELRVEIPDLRPRELDLKDQERPP